MKFLRISGSFMAGIVVGAGLVAYGPEIKKFIARYGRPVLKEIIKSGMQLMENGQEIAEKATSAAGDATKKKPASVD